MRILLLLLFWCIPVKLFAGPCLKPGIHLSQLIPWILDDPQTLFQQSSIDLGSLRESDKAPAVLCPLVAGLAEIYLRDRTTVDIEAFENGARVAQILGLADEGLLLEALILHRHMQQGQPLDQAQLLNFLQRADGRSIETRVLLQARFFRVLNTKERARYELRLRLFAADAKMPVTMRAFVAEHFTRDMEYRKNPKRAINAVKEVLLLIDSLNLRYFKAKSHYNLGLMYSFAGNDNSITEGEKSYQSALEQLKTLPPSRLQGAVLIGLAELSNQRGHLQEALNLLKSSFNFFQEPYDQQWIGEAYIKSAEIYNKQHLWPKALDALDKARKIIPDKNVYDHILIYEREAVAYMGLHAYPKAYEALATYADKFEEYNDAFALDTYEAEAARFGLQAEVEKTHQAREQTNLATENLRLEAIKTSSMRLQLSQRFGFAMLIVLLLAIGTWVSINVMRNLWKLRRNNQYIATQVLQRFMPPVLIQEILRGSLRLHEKPVQRLVTALSVDIVSFTEATETLGTQEISRILNHFMVATTETIFAHNGLIERYVGDAVMVIFGDSGTHQPNDQAYQAITCAEAILKQLNTINLELENSQGWNLRVRIGIHQGMAVVGNIGHAARMEYMALGEAVNFAHKLQEEANPDEILMSSSVIQHLPNEAYSTRASHRRTSSFQELYCLHPIQQWKKSA